MKRIRFLILALCVFAVLGMTQGCMQPGIREVKGRNIDIQIEDEKIIVMIKTRCKPETYGGGVRSISVIDTFSNSMIVLNDINNYYIRGDMIIIEIDKTDISEYLIGFNWISVLLIGRPQEIYDYKSDEFIFLAEEKKK
jgi:hypothetical protein